MDGLELAAMIAKISLCVPVQTERIDHDLSLRWLFVDTAGGVAQRLNGAAQYSEYFSDGHEIKFKPARGLLIIGPAVQGH